MYESFNSNEIRSRLRVKYNFIINTRLVLHIMIIILNLLEEGRISDAHYFYVKKEAGRRFNNFLTRQSIDFSCDFCYTIYVERTWAINLVVKVTDL